MSNVDIVSHQWIKDRVYNREPLWWNRFIEFIEHHPNYTNVDIKKYKSNVYRRAVRKVYEQFKRANSGSNFGGVFG